MLASIGTTHPWNIAGVGLDAHVAAEYGVAHTCAIVAVSAQDESGVHGLETVSPGLLRAQLESLPRGIAAFRIGALVASEHAAIAATFLKRCANGAAIVVDPVMRASLGGELQRTAGLSATLRDAFAPLGVIFTPNLQEAEELTGVRVYDERTMREAAQRLVELGAAGAVVTGGHLEGDPVDVYVGRNAEVRLGGPRLPGDMRGSGCTFAAALACELALGHDAADAVNAAHAYVREKIAAGRMRGGLQVAF